MNLLLSTSAAETKKGRFDEHLGEEVLMRANSCAWPTYRQRVMRGDDHGQSLWPCGIQSFSEVDAAIYSTLETLNDAAIASTNDEAALQSSMRWNGGAVIAADGRERAVAFEEF